MGKDDMFLYWGSGSVPCWRLMIVLEEKGFSGYPNKLISFGNKEHKSEPVLKLNPRGQVPTFKDGDVVVNESTAACEYLEARYKDQGNMLIPKDPVQMALVLQRGQEAISNMTASLMMKVIYLKMFAPAEKLDQEQFSKNLEDLRVELDRWDGYLKGQSFLAGSALSMADIYFFPYIAFAVRVGLRLDKFPNLKAYYDRMCEQKSVKATWPPHWNDGPLAPEKQFLSEF